MKLSRFASAETISVSKIPSAIIQYRRERMNRSCLAIIDLSFTLISERERERQRAVIAKAEEGSQQSLACPGLFAAAYLTLSLPPPPPPPTPSVSSSPFCHIPLPPLMFAGISHRAFFFFL